jgi:VIT1/CCC1 family predicted Fe2+/Mn2+ transporter
MSNYSNKQAWAAFGVIYFFAALIMVFGNLFAGESVIKALAVAFAATVVFVFAVGSLVAFLSRAFGEEK